MKIVETFKPVILTFIVIVFSFAADAQNIESKKGAWSDADIQKFNQEVASVESDLEAFGENKQEFIDCYFDKVQNKYKSFVVANSKAKGCEKLAVKCAKEVMGI